MPARYRRSYGTYRSTPRRRTEWVELSHQDAIGAGTAVNYDLCAASPDDVFTVMRTILRITVQNWAAVADILTFGTMVGRASDIGTTPNLASDPGLDWSWKGALTPESTGAAVDVIQHYDIDIKSKRKVTDSSLRYLLCWTNGSAASKTVQVFSRTLIAPV